MIVFALFTAAFAQFSLSAPKYGSEIGDFSAFVRFHNKTYESREEYAMRYQNFKDNVDRINAHNAEGHSYSFGLTPFADMSQYEFAMFIKRGNGGGFVENRNVEKNYAKSSVASCDSVDWVSKGSVTPVKNQGQCGSCWSFSTTGSVESRCYINGKSSTLESLSEEMLVECDYSSWNPFKNHGCQGGSMDSAIQWIQTNGGLATETDYPYTSGSGSKGSCESSGKTLYCAPTGKVDVTAADMDSMASAVCDGPVSIAIEADQNAFQLYNGGVFDGTCGTALDHGVLLVGFGTDSGSDYWKVKNSWGSSWGESGYIRMVKGAGTNGGKGQCGILMGGVYPTF